MRVIASWSGGKDSCLALHKALLQGRQVVRLVNFVSREFNRVSFHGVRARLVSRQAGAIGIAASQFRVPPDLALYEARFKTAVRSMQRRYGVEGMVFGDIHLEEHRGWVERVCAELGITALLPLWGMTSEDVLNDFIESGFEAVVTSTQASLMGQEWLGRRVDRSFEKDIKALALERQVDVCGEMGEFHTLAVDGPVFQERLEITRGVEVQRDGYWFLDIPRWRTTAKVHAGVET